MQTPKSGSKTSSFGASQIISPKSITSEASHKNSPRASSCEASNKSSLRVAREVKISPRYAEPTASSCNLASRPPKEGSPKVPNHRSPRSLLPENKGPNRAAELESKISLLEHDLKNTKDQLFSSEKSKHQAQRDAAESRQLLLALSVKLKQYQKQILNQSSSTKTVDNLSYLSENSDDSSSLAFALNEIQLLEARLEIVAGPEPEPDPEPSNTKLCKLEGMKSELMNSTKSESQAKDLVHETLIQLETAKKTVETLKSDECKAKENQNARALEIERLRAHMNFLEELVGKLEAEKKRDGKSIVMDLNSMKLEAERIKRESGRREAELEAGLRKSRYEIEEMKGNIMDKENEIQSMCEENDGLLMQLEDLKTKLKDKERECVILSDENEKLKSEMKEIIVKIGILTEEVVKSDKKASRVFEQLEAAQKANIEMEVEFRKLKVQCDQWRKAAEVAAAMVSGGSNGQLVVERTESMDSSYISPDFFYGDDFVKKKNGKMLSRISSHCRCSFVPLAICYPSRPRPRRRREELSDAGVATTGRQMQRRWRRTADQWRRMADQWRLV
ncbi:Interactor of constitutive active ROPs 3 [Striga hermonthica]|uniref:Interactor of constitutive active ROPs 3 n=1 Tax=Striga hermonthica TaxID=68872 RepID=A0A9N7R3L4_STRHE|nr:Interactor of constitutive active ROPs 3 [Striga hermonthica]